MTSAVIDAAGLVQLVSTLISRGYRVLGPVQSDDAIVLAELDSADDLPSAWGGRRPSPAAAAIVVFRRQNARGGPAVRPPRGASLRSGRDRDPQWCSRHGRSSRFPGTQHRHTA